eukprot:1047712-Pyramimonas_sp.AAC.1
MAPHGLAGIAWLSGLPRCWQNLARLAGVRKRLAGLSRAYQGPAGPCRAWSGLTYRGLAEGQQGLAALSCAWRGLARPCTPRQGPAGHIPASLWLARCG